MAAKSGRGVPVSVGRERGFAPQPINEMQNAERRMQTRPRRTRRAASSLCILHFAFGILDLLFDLLFVRARAFARERLRPRVDGLLPPRAAGVKIADMFQYLGVLRQLGN